MKSKQQIDSLIIALLIGTLPVFILSLGHASAIFYALTIVSAVICLTRPGGFSATMTDWHRYRWLASGLFSMMLVILIVMVAEQRILGAAFERAIRIGVGTFVILGACLSLRPSWLRQSIWGIGLGALVAAA